MARKALCVMGGVLMIISIFLPVFYIHTYDDLHGERGEWLIFYWMIGNYIGRVIISEGHLKGKQYIIQGFLGNQFNMFGIICMIFIINGAILALATSGKHSNIISKKLPFIGGILGLLGMMVYFISFYLGVYYGIHISPLSTQIKHLLPCVGFYVCLLGSYLTIFGGFLET